MAKQTAAQQADSMDSKKGERGRAKSYQEMNDELEGKDTGGWSYAERGREKSYGEQNADLNSRFPEFKKAEDEETIQGGGTITASERAEIKRRALERYGFSGYDYKNKGEWS